MNTKHQIRKRDSRLRFPWTFACGICGTVRQRSTREIAMKAARAHLALHRLGLGGAR